MFHVKQFKIWVAGYPLKPAEREDKIMFDYTEFNKLCTGLIEKGYSIKVHSIWDGKQVIVYDEQDEIQWDAVIHYFSYGHEDGLLEVYGTIVDSFDKHKYCICGDTVLGNLKAEQILEVC